MRFFLYFAQPLGRIYFKITTLLKNNLKTLESKEYATYFNDQGYLFLEQHLIKNAYSKLFILTDSNTGEHCLPRFLAQLATDIPFEIIEIEAGEEHKTLETCQGVWETLAELDGDRKSLLINLGGGVVTDLGGFVAGCFKRGIDCIHVPTSLLAMVDAAQGGKNGVDLGVIKNQIGLVYPPVAVIVDTAFLYSLPADEMRSGLAEMLKHGLISDRNYWSSLIHMGDASEEQLDEFIHTSIKIKNNIVEQDPLEKGIRKALNFGHTLGHAIESFFMEHPRNEKPIKHGEAVAAGMVLESHISLQLGWISREEYEEIKTVIMNYYGKLDILIKDINTLQHWMKFDKKNSHGKVRFALIKEIGSVEFDVEIDESLIIKAIEDYNL